MLSPSFGAAALGGGFRRKLLKVAVPGTLALQLMPSVVENFMREQPGAVLEVLSGSYSDAERAILSREADIGFVRLPAEMPGLEVVPCLESEAVCIMPKGHPLERLNTVAIENLEDLPLILLGRQRLMRQEIDMAFRQARFIPRICAEVHSVGIACSFVSKGLGISIVNALLASYCRDMGFTSRPFRPRIAYQVGLASLGKLEADPLRHAFAEHLIDAMLASLRPDDCTRRV